MGPREVGGARRGGSHFNFFPFFVIFAFLLVLLFLRSERTVCSTNVRVTVVLVCFVLCGGGGAFTRARTDGDASAG